MNQELRDYYNLQINGSSWSIDSAWGDQMEAAVKEYGLTLIPNSRVLDVGCGEGRGVNAFKQIGLESYGIDVNTDKLQNTHYPDIKTRLSYADFHELPFQDKFFDYVFCSHAIEHSLDPFKVFNELIRVSRIGGLVICPIENERTTLPEPNSSPHTSTFLTDDDWYALVLKLKNKISFKHEVKNRIGREIWTTFKINK